jgi:hypothetical protein
MRQTNQWALARCLSSKSLFLLPLVIALLDSASVANASTVFVQDWTGTFNGSASRVDGQQVADDFSISQNSSILSLSWYGLDSGGSSSLSGVTSANFAVRLYADTNTAPGQALNLTNSPSLTPIYETAVTASVSPTGNMNAQNWSIYKFQANLPTAMVLQSDTAYWLSILSNGIGFDWVPSTLGGNAVFRPCCNSDGSQWLEVLNADHSDMTFILNDQRIPSPVPLPPSIALQLTGLALLGLLAWRRKRKGAAANAV